MVSLAPHYPSVGGPAPPSPAKLAQKLKKKNKYPDLLRKLYLWPAIETPALGPQKERAAQEHGP